MSESGVEVSSQGSTLRGPLYPLAKAGDADRVREREDPGYRIREEQPSYYLMLAHYAVYATLSW